VIDDLKTIIAFTGVINEDKFQIIEALNLVLYKNIDFVDALLCIKGKLYDLMLFSFDDRLNKRCA
jgi:predicted nucleic-acid-binding protein